MKKWEKLSFRRKIFAGMLFAAGIPMLIGYLVMLQIFNITYQKKLNQEANMILNATAGSLDSESYLPPDSVSSGSNLS